MKGLILYEPGVAQERTWFIDKFISEFKNLGVELLLDTPDTRTLADFAIMRAIAPKESRILEEKGIKVFNSAFIARLCNDKAATYDFVSRLNGIDGILGYKSIFRHEDLEDFVYPAVVKSRDGHGGTEVYLVKNARDAIDKLTDESIYSGRFIIQKLCDSPGMDVRVYMLGDKVLAAMKRESSVDFRANFCLGGSANKIDLPDEIRKEVYIIQEAIASDFVGIDYIYNNGRWVFNEIEDVVGCRMLYSLTDIDPVRLYAGYIVDKMGGLL